MLVANLSERDTLFIEQQLGRKPRGIKAVAVRDEINQPIVLQMRSWVGDKPFPTLFWLCDKTLHTAINQLETKGLVKQLEQNIQDDAALKQALLDEQAFYQHWRHEEMLDEDAKQLSEKGLLALFDSYGVGGIKQWDKLRCLHMHYAYHLARMHLKPDVGGTVIGGLIQAELESE